MVRLRLRDHIIEILRHFACVHPVYSWCIDLVEPCLSSEGGYSWALQWQLLFVFLGLCSLDPLFFSFCFGSAVAVALRLPRIVFPGSFVVFFLLGSAVAVALLLLPCILCSPRSYYWSVSGLCFVLSPVRMCDSGSFPVEGGVPRSHSRPSRLPSEAILSSAAPRKPRAEVPSAADCALVRDSARKLFTSGGSASDSVGDDGDGDDGNGDNVDLSGGDFEFEDDKEGVDTGATPRPTIPGTLVSSVFDHFLANPELVHDVVHVATGAASGAASGAFRVVQAAAASLLSNAPEYPPVPPAPPIPPPPCPPVPPRPSVCPPAMAMKFPDSKYLKTDSVAMFDGTPQDLDTFELNI